MICGRSVDRKEESDGILYTVHLRDSTKCLAIMHLPAQREYFALFSAEACYGASELESSFSVMESTSAFGCQVVHLLDSLNSLSLLNHSRRNL